MNIAYHSLCINIKFIHNSQPTILYQQTRKCITYSWWLYIIRHRKLPIGLCQMSKLALVLVFVVCWISTRLNKTNKSFFRIHKNLSIFTPFTEKNQTHDRLLPFARSMMCVFTKKLFLLYWALIQTYLN